MKPSHDAQNDLTNLSGDTLELALAEIGALHSNAVEANARLRDETQHVQTVAAIVVSLMLALPTPPTGIGHVFSTIAVVLLILSVFGSFLFLFSRPPITSSEFEIFLAEQKEPITVDFIRRHRLSRILEVSRTGAALIRKRTMYVNLIKAVLANSIIFVGMSVLLQGA